jgi:hypothetical protein
MPARRWLGDDIAAVNNYLIALGNFQRQIVSMRNTQHARVTTYVNDARARGVAEWWVIVNVLQPWNAWDQAIADLADITIVLEIKRVQQGGTIGNLANFQPAPAPALPAMPDPSSGSGSTSPGSAPANSPPATIPPAGSSGGSSSTTTPPTDWLEGSVAGIPVKALVIGGGAFLLLVLVAKR